MNTINYFASPSGSLLQRADNTSEKWFGGTDARMITQDGELAPFASSLF
jgi:hypothetical protein